MDQTQVKIIYKDSGPAGNLLELIPGILMRHIRHHLVCYGLLATQHVFSPFLSRSIDW